MLDNTSLSRLSPKSPGTRASRFGRLTLEVRQHMPAWQHVAISATSVLLGLAISAAILVVAGVEPSDLFQEIFLDNLLIKDNFLAVLRQTAPLLFVGLAAALAFRVRFWNLGIEGQMIWGGIGATAVSVLHIGPEFLRLPLMMCFAVLAGMAWAAVALLLKMRLRVSEIISTLLLNYIAANYMLHLLYGAWLDPVDSFPHSAQFSAYERLPDLSWGLSSALLIGLVFVGIAWWLVRVSRLGLYMKFVYSNARMALAVGIPIVGVTVGAVLLSGALAATAGFVIATGLEGRLTQGFYRGYGFSGILIAFLAQNDPLIVTVVAFLVALLFDTGRSLQVFYQIPFAMVQLIQAVIVTTVAASEFFVRYRIHWVRGLST
jgi:general nucleoside transport system permease protein